MFQLVSFGFASGGSEFKGETIDEYNKREKEESIQYRLPFGGGSGAGVSINPIAFLVVQSNCVKLLPVNHSSSVDRLLDYMPDLVEKTNQLINKCMQNKKEDKNREEQERRRREREEIKVKRPEKIQMEVEVKPEEQEEKKEPINIQNIIKVEEDD